jgi:hypothetical protein
MLSSRQLIEQGISNYTVQKYSVTLTATISNIKLEKVAEFVSLDCEENDTVYCYGVVSYKASHAVRPLSGLLCVPYLSSNYS